MPSKKKKTKYDLNMTCENQPLSICDSQPGKHLKAGHHQRPSETPFKWRFTSGPMLARHCVLAGYIQNRALKFLVFERQWLEKVLVYHQKVTHAIGLLVKPCGVRWQSVRLVIERLLVRDSLKVLCCVLE